MRSAQFRDGVELQVGARSENHQEIHIYVPREWNQRVKEYAGRNKISRNLAIVRLVGQVLDAEETE